MIKNYNGYNYNEDYIGDNFDIMSGYYIKFKNDGDYIICHTYMLNKYDNEAGDSSRDCPNINNEGYIFSLSQMTYNAPQEGTGRISSSRLRNSDVASGYYPYLAKIIRFIKVRDGKIEVLPPEDKQINLEYKLLFADFDPVQGTITFKDKGERRNVFLRFDNTVHFNNWYNSTFNEYRSLNTTYTENYKIENGFYMAENSFRKVDYYDGWFSSNDHLYLSLAQTVVIKLES